MHFFRNIVTSAGTDTYLIKSVENSTNVFLKSFQIVVYFYLYLRPGIIIVSVCGGQRPEQEAELPRALGGSHQEVHGVLQHHP